MNRHRLIIASSIVLSLASLTGVCVQHRQLAGLRLERQQLLDQDDAINREDTQPATELPSAVAPELRPSASPSSELLRLRNQVGQLRDRQRELQNAQGENERLRVQIAARGTNVPAAAALPPGYIRQSQAQWVGLSTPQNTIQSFLWALQNRDLPNLFRAMTPEAAEKLRVQIGDTPEQFFKDSAGLPGMRIVSQETLPDGSIKAQLEIMPGAPTDTHHSSPIRFRQIGGEWKMDIP